MRTIVFSDPHGCFDRMMALLEKVKYDKYKDRLIVLGDLVDRGYKSKEVVQYLLQMSKSYDVQVVGGNHDEMFTYWLSDPPEGFLEYTETDPEKDYIGGIYTINSFIEGTNYSNDKDIRSFIKEKYAEEVQFLRNLPDFIEEESYIFVHGGINPMLADWRNSTRKDFRYAKSQFFWWPHEHPQTFVFGHTITSKLHKDKANFSIWEGHNQIGIDGGCCGGHQLNALIITEEGYTWDYVKGGRS